MNFGKHFFNLLLSCLLIIIIINTAKATHNRAGEIVIQSTGTNCLSYKVLIKTYTDIRSQVIRDEYSISWGDGDSTKAIRVNGVIINGVGQGEILPNNPDTRYNLYEATHSYSSALGEIIITVNDPNRNADIINMANSVNVPFFLQSKILINSFIGCNSNPVMSNPPIGDACLNKKYEHNPGAIDPEGDSLVYELVSSLTSGGVPTPGYGFPQGMTINSQTGTVVWPQAGLWLGLPTQAKYNFAILITEYRRIGNKIVKIGEVLRDMQVNVKPCVNNPPLISPINEKCVIAGQNLNFKIKISDPDPGDLIKLNATGQPFNFVFSQNPASIIPTTINFVPGPDSLTFNWNTICVHLRSSPYPVYMSLVDDDFNELYDYETFNIKVILGPPAALTANVSGSYIILNWNPSNCVQTNKYLIYRKKSCDTFTQSFCQTGIDPTWGYDLIGTNLGNNNTNFTDNNNNAGLSTGIIYSYRIVAETNTNLQSVISTNVCAQLKRDVPVILNVDINTTNQTNGNVFVRWTKPLTNTNALDTIQNPGPYQFKLYFTQNLNGNGVPTLLQTYTATTFKALIDTTYIHNTANTTLALNYTIEFYANSNLLSTKKSSSVFLNGKSTNATVDLNWSTIVPWTEDTFYVYRKLKTESTFQFIAKNNTKKYIDNSVILNNEYCYYVISYSSYSATNLPKPLINKSQEFCILVKDTIAPCPPKLTTTAICDSFSNKLSWTDAKEDSCGLDIIKYTWYYAANDSINFTPLDSNNAFILNFLHKNLIVSLAGCYYIKSIDSAGNRSLPSNIVCTENCPIFTLPNIFTPNADNQNDVFKAIKQQYIKEIDLTIFDRWGAKIFETKDPNFTWDGVNKLTNKTIGDATVFYTCKVIPYFIYKEISFNINDFVKIIKN